MSETKLTPDNAKAVGIIVIVIVVAALAIYIVKKFFGGLSGIGAGLGLTDDAATAAAKDKITAATGENTDPGSPWATQFYKDAPAGANLVTVADAQKIAKSIYDSTGFISYLDDAGEALAAIKQLPSQAAFSFMVEQFDKLYNYDLFAWMQRYYDTDRDKQVFAQIIDYVDNLTPYN